jgi:hypothetical protein
VAVGLPGEDRLPPGPLRDLVVALHELYRSAGKPGFRVVSDAIKSDDSLPDTVSYETIGAILGGRGLAKWSKLECLVRQLARMAVTRPDEDGEIRRFHGLWLIASDAVVRPVEPPTDSLSLSLAETRNGEVAIHRRAAAAPYDVRLSHLPSRNPRFTGRKEILSHLASALTPGVPLALIGSAGVGKTQIAVEYIYQNRDQYDLIWWVPAEQTTTIRSSLDSLHNHLGLPQRSGVQQNVRRAVARGQRVRQPPS